MDTQSYIIWWKSTVAVKIIAVRISYITFKRYHRWLSLNEHFFVLYDTDK